MREAVFFSFLPADCYNEIGKGVASSPVKADSIDTRLFQGKIPNPADRMLDFCRAGLIYSAVHVELPPMHIYALNLAVIVVFYHWWSFLSSRLGLVI